MRRLLYIFLSLIVISSCRRELCYDYRPFTDVVMEVDWSKFVETPSGMTAMFYPKGGGEPVTYSTHNIHKSTFALRTGIYDVILFNQRPAEFATLGFRGMDRFETAEVYAKEVESKTWYSKTDVETVSYEPEPFAVAIYENLEVTEEMRDRTDSKAGACDLIMTPMTVTNRAIVTIHIDGLYNLRSARGSVTGMAEGLMMSSSAANDTEVTHLLEAWQCFADADNPAQGRIVTDYRTFGMPGMKLRNAVNLWGDAFLNVSLLLVDNSTVKDYSFPVGENVRLDEQTNEIVLRISLERESEDSPAPVVLPDVKPADGSSSGFDADMDSWGDEIGVVVPVN